MKFFTFHSSLFTLYNVHPLHVAQLNKKRSAQTWLKREKCRQYSFLTARMYLLKVNIYFSNCKCIINYSLICAQRPRDDRRLTFKTNDTQMTFISLRRRIQLYSGPNNIALQMKRFATHRNVQHIWRFAEVQPAPY